MAVKKDKKKNTVSRMVSVCELKIMNRNLC